MRRAGGYPGYWSAFERLLLESARPIDSHSVGALDVGTHTVHIEVVEWGWNFVDVEFVGSRGRLHTRLDTEDPRLEQLCRAVGVQVPARGDFGRLTSKVGGAEVRVDIRRIGDAEVSVCQDRTWLVRVAGEIQFRGDSPREVDEWLSSTNLKPIRREIALIRPMVRGAAPRTHMSCSDQSRPSLRGSRTSTQRTY